MTDPGGPDRHPLAGRQRRLIVALRVAVAVVLAAALVGLSAPRSIGDPAATVFVAVLIAAPLLRLMWLLVRWLRRGDLRFAGTVVVLLVVVAAAAATAWW